MIITRTPFRISFVGGGSDLESFYSLHEGAVLSTTINKYMYISSHKYFEADKIRVKYSQTETVNKPEELQHPIFREAFKLCNIDGGIEVSSIADVPSGTGMGSSSSFTVGVLHNLYTLNHQIISKEMLASAACDIEINQLKEPIGKQDQYAAAYGGLNIYRFQQNGNVLVDPLFIEQEIMQTLEDNLVMFYYGNQRSASQILAEQKVNNSIQAKQENLKQMVALVDELKTALYQGDLQAFGKILHVNWLLKKELASQISNGDIDTIYELALKNGAIGGKLLGAGGGGFLLFYCEKQHQAKLIKALHKLPFFDFKFDHEGSKLIYTEYED
jgi:D-glycero-alpha-D-manno-heptose-7-phosphate kinase